MRTHVSLVLLICGFGGMAAAQATPADRAGGPEGLSTVGKSTKWDQLSSRGQSGNYLVGKVVVDGGQLPWDPIPISVLCDGAARTTVLADAKGNFQINSQDTSGAEPIKSDDARHVTSQYFGCKIRAYLAGYESSTVNIMNRSMLDDPSVDTVRLKRVETQKAIGTSETTLSAPKDAAKAFEKARAAYIDGKPDQAQKSLEKAVQIYPQFAEAWFQLGRLQEKSAPDAAHDSYQKSIAADARYLPAYEALTRIDALGGKWQEALDVSSRALAADPEGTPQLWYFNATANLRLGNVDAAENSARKGVDDDPLHIAMNTEQLLAVILTRKQEYAEALQHLQNCLTYFPKGPSADVVKQQIAQLQDVVKPAGK